MNPDPERINGAPKADFKLRKAILDTVMGTAVKLPRILDEIEHSYG